MSEKKRRRSARAVPSEPVIPASKLYRALERIARAIAERLNAGDERTATEAPVKTREK